MNKGRLVGGIICLALAALLLVLSIRLPTDKLMFMVGGINVPMIILALVGLASLVTARKRQSV
jgi:LytS/YehU family sensor histidine kinase